MSRRPKDWHPERHDWQILSHRVTDGEYDYELAICRRCILRRRVRLTHLQHREYLPNDVSGWQNATRKCGRCPGK